MKILEYGDFARLPEGTIYSYYFPPAEEREHSMRTVLPHTEGLYVKDETFNADPASDKPFIRISLLPEVHDSYEQFRGDEASHPIWESDGAYLPDTGDWAYEPEPHYYVVYEEDDLQRLRMAIEEASRAIKGAAASP